MNERLMLVTGRAVADASGIVASGDDAALLIDMGPAAEGGQEGGLPRLLAMGAKAKADERAKEARRVERGDAVLIPGLVNAHVHLDLTHLGPREHRVEDGFVRWVEMVREGRETTEAGIRESVRQGIELSRSGGTVAVGDIAGAPFGRPSLVPFEVLKESGMLGVSFLEFFAIGTGEKRGIAAATEALERAGMGGDERPDGGARLGLQPHAPNTVGQAGYRWAVERSKERGIPLSTHLAETMEEQEFVGHLRGAQRELLERLGLWDEALTKELGLGVRPVRHLGPMLGRAPFLAAHVNDADDDELRTLARTGTTVVYCPRASAYFGAEHHFGAHRYQEMRNVGIRVALGTDSIVNLNTPDRISVLDEMRLLHRRDGIGARALFKMGTVNGAGALGLDPAWFRFQKSGGSIAGVVAVAVDGDGDPLEAVVKSESAPELLLDRNYCC